MRVKPGSISIFSRRDFFFCLLMLPVPSLSMQNMGRGYHRTTAESTRAQDHAEFCVAFDEDTIA